MAQTDDSDSGRGYANGDGRRGSRPLEEDERQRLRRLLGAAQLQITRMDWDSAAGVELLGEIDRLNSGDPAEGVAPVPLSWIADELHQGDLYRRLSRHRMARQPGGDQ